MNSASCFGRRAAAFLVGAAAVAGVSGCHSHYIEATVRNASGAAISPFEVDYPSASFGRPTLADGAEYKYRFKVLGSGPTKVIWTDPQHSEHTAQGPALSEGNEGRLTVTVKSDKAELTFSPGTLAEK